MTRVAKTLEERAQGRKIVLCGTSLMAEALREMLNAHGLDAAFFTDRNFELFRNFSRPVKPPGCLNPNRHFPVIVPFGAAAIESIEQALHGLGYVCDDWFCWTRSVDYDIVFNGMRLGKHFQLCRAFAQYSAGRCIKSVGRFASVEHSFKFGADHNFGLTTSALLPALAPGGGG